MEKHRYSFIRPTKPEIFKLKLKDLAVQAGWAVPRIRFGFYLRLHDIVNHGTFDNEPLILIDGVPVFDTDKMMAFDPIKIRKLEAVTKAFFHGQSAFAGIVSLTTYPGDLGGFEVHPGSVTLDFAGLQRSQEF